MASINISNLLPDQNLHRLASLKISDGSYAQKIRAITGVQNDIDKIYIVTGIQVGNNTIELIKYSFQHNSAYYKQSIT